MSRRGLFADEVDVPLIPSKKISDGELDITPMIDVTFLLLIFFMVGSTMQPQADVDLPIAHYGVGVEPGKATSIIIRMQKNAAGEMASLLMDGANGQPQLTDLDGIRRRAGELVRAGRRQFLIKAERHVPHRTVQDVARALVETEGAQFYIGVNEK